MRGRTGKPGRAAISGCGMETGMTVLLALRIVAALGCGLMAGVFFAFSTSVMRGLARLGPAEAIAAMQAMNRAILNPLFLACFFGSAVACILAMVSALWQ